MRIGLVAAIAALLVGSAGCGKSKAQKLAALDDAYRAGVFTRQEYDAKRAALLGSAPAPAPPQSATATVSVPQPLAAPPQAPPVSPATATPSASPAEQPAKAAPPTIAKGPVKTPKPSPMGPPPTKAAPEPAIPSAPPATAAPPVTEAQPPATPPVETPTRPADAEPPPAPVAGCENGEFRAGREGGVRERFYAAPVASVRRSAEAALKNLDFSIHKNSRDEIEASRGKHLGSLIGSGGDRLVLRFDKSERGGHSGTLVTGETKKRLLGKSENWTDAVLAQIACELGR
ncbi:MAG TPA: hypothetical protein VHW24_07935 [Bryobacteraceae bacterium]|nr:hypothetical protein [Bryobacteraceae bacterium]